MRTTKIMNALLIFALFGLAFASLAPTASAQRQKVTLTVTLDSQPSDVPLKPLQAPIELKGKVKFLADGASTRTSLTGVTISFQKTQGPNWATVVISPPSLVLNLPAPSGPSATVEAEEDFKVLVSASAEAPAFQETEIEIEAVSAESSAFERGSGKAKASIRAYYFSILDVSLPETIKVERPQTPSSFPITVTNFGNGPTKVLFEVVSKPSNENFQVIPPQALQLESRQAGGSQITKDAILQVQTPYKNGYMNEPGAVTLKLTSHYAPDSTVPGATDQVTMLVTTKGFYVPGPSPILLVGLLLVVALVVRKVRG